MADEVKEASIIPPDMRIGAYCDVVRLDFSPYTFNFEFSQAIPPDEKQEQTTICLGRIVTSPNFAKLLNQYLSDRIKEYEEKFGMIALPKTEG